MDRFADIFIDLRHRAIIVAALAVAIAAAFLVLHGTAQSRSTTVDHGLADAFGLGRSTVLVTPGAKVSGALSVPVDTVPDSVALEVSGPGVSIASDGPEFEFVAPSEGVVVLTARVTSHGHKLTTRTTFRVVGFDGVMGVALNYDGTVLVDGGRAVAGEAIRAGTHLDARKGSVSYRVRATTDGQVAGRVKFSGTEFTATARIAGTRVINDAKMARTANSTNTLHVQAEHLDGGRYQTVSGPDAVAMVKGTEFDVTVTPDHTAVRVTNGIVYTLDRFRYYVNPRNLEAGDSMEVDAVTLALAAQLAGATLQTGGGAIESSPISAASANDVHQDDVLDDHDQIADTLLDDTANEHKAPPPTGGGGFDAENGTPSDNGPTGGGSTGGGGTPVSGGGVGPSTGGDGGGSGGGATGGTGTGTSDQGSGTGDTTGTGTTGGTTTTTTTNNTGTNTGTNTGGSTPTKDPVPQVKLPPPGVERYQLEGYDPKRCLDTYVLWNGTYGDGAARHLCVNRKALGTYFDDSHGYSPLKAWGCFTSHAVWRTRSDGTAGLCFPTPQADVDSLTTYDAPFQRNQLADGTYEFVRMPCSDKHHRRDSSSTICVADGAAASATPATSVSTATAAATA